MAFASSAYPPTPPYPHSPLLLSPVCLSYSTTMSLVTLSNHARTERATNRGPDVYPFWDTDLNDLYSRLIPPADSNLTNTSYVPPQGTALHNCWINLIKAIRKTPLSSQM
ncbi:uncharacterized protein UBRO_20057 [Ustilago bromivora]|uniref:Uncharacterized protein n=1 Tax=Ustilago bromivora TaxID=307758 RepID=A0A1K0G522_9BASI|nr:uncharacterized protein UBRO_20057 [Ustilago bromivora]